MELEKLTAIAPVDGRYRSKTEALAPYFSEFGLIRYRILMEVEYFLALTRLPSVPMASINEVKAKSLRSAYLELSPDEAKAVKDIEKITNHDVKAVEYFLRNKFDELGLSEYKEFIHFGLTSQDINNTALPLMLKEAYENVYTPLFQAVEQKIVDLGKEWSNVSMLARTHGQPASPTLLGKEFWVFAERLQKQFKQLDALSFSAKFGGATGNFNAHFVAFPDVDWFEFADNLLGNLGLQRQQYTTQIEHYDNLAAFFDAMRRINIILIDLCRDVWAYVSMDYFKQKIKKNEVGSSAMPHKVNPIDFENAEGNLGIANALLAHLAEKLPISRLQRDLTDSTVSRNIGLPMAHTVIAMQSLLKGLDKLLLNRKKMDEDLSNHWEVVTEGIQNILRRENFPNPYDKLKELSRTNEKISKATIHAFVDTLDLPDGVKTELKRLTPHNYVGKVLDFE